MATILPLGPFDLLIYLFLFWNQHKSFNPIQKFLLFNINLFFSVLKYFLIWLPLKNLQNRIKKFTFHNEAFCLLLFWRHFVQQIILYHIILIIFGIMGKQIWPIFSTIKKAFFERLYCSYKWILYQSMSTLYKAFLCTVCGVLGTIQKFRRFDVDDDQEIQ